jgi:LSD1 subclass zinc finger protein
MNPFVNPKKRGVQLPKGCKDLVEVLQGSNRVKCEYCGAPAVALSFMGMVDYRWCMECQRDLKEFAKIEVPKGMLVDTSDEAAVTRYRAEMQRREDDFMRQRVKERRPQ